MAYNIRQSDPSYDPLEAQLAEYFEAGRKSASDANDAVRRNIESLIKLREVRQANRERELRDRENRTRIRAQESRAKQTAARQRIVLGGIRTKQQNQRFQQQLAYRQQRDQELAREREAARAQRNARFAQQQAYRESVLADRQAKRRAQGYRGLGRAGSQLGGASYSTGVPSVGGGPSKEAVAKFIIFATALAAIGAVAHDVSKAPLPPEQFTTGTGVKVKIPQHLRSLGGAFIAGTIALVINEVYPAAGLVMGAGIVGLVVIPTWTPILNRLGGHALGGLTPTTAPKSGATTPPFPPGAHNPVPHTPITPPQNAPRGPSPVGIG